MKFNILLSTIFFISCPAAQAPQETIKLVDCDLQSIHSITKITNAIGCLIKEPLGTINVHIKNKKTAGKFTGIKGETHYFNDQDAQELYSYLEMRFRLNKPQKD